MKKMTENMIVTNCVKCGMRTYKSCPNYANCKDDERSSALIYSALYAGIA